MIDVSRLLCGKIGSADLLRYARKKKPVVVWNMTRRCNLHCVHCYIEARDTPLEEELSTAEAERMIDDLARFGVPVLLFSGGEPMTRDDLFHLGSYAVSKGMRTVISTNGTLISQEAAQRIKEAGFSYVGVSLDGMEETNDAFRGKAGAFREALRGIRNCSKKGIRVGLRFTLNRRNLADLPDIFDLLEKERIPRCCIYHLVYSGRGKSMVGDSLRLEETRRAVEMIFAAARDFFLRQVDIELLTVDNHADGAYLYLKLLKEDPKRAEAVLELLRNNGGNNSGISIGCVSEKGDVYADQFWRHHCFGNIRQVPFSQIWTDASHPLLAGLRDRKRLLGGRCADCRFLEICNGNFRARAEAATGDIWAPDPACYLTDEEVYS